MNYIILIWKRLIGKSKAKKVVMKLGSWNVLVMRFFQILTFHLTISILPVKLTLWAVPSKAFS